MVVSTGITVALRSAGAVIRSISKKKTLSCRSRHGFDQLHSTNPLEPVRQFISNTKKASFLASSENYHEMRQLLPKLGTNPKLTDRSLSQTFTPPFQFLASTLSGFTPTSPFAPSARRISGITSAESSFLSGCRESDPVYIDPIDAYYPHTPARLDSLC